MSNSTLNSQLSTNLRQTEKWIRDMGNQFIDPAKTRKLFHDHADRIGKAAAIAEIWQLIEDLRENCGGVNILCDNEEPPPNVGIDVFGEWTEWKEKRYSGDTILACLQAAKADMERVNRETR